MSKPSGAEDQRRLSKEARDDPQADPADRPDARAAPRADRALVLGAHRGGPGPGGGRDRRRPRRRQRPQRPAVTPKPADRTDDPTASETGAASRAVPERT